jgi:hypothetical protein
VTNELKQAGFQVQQIIGNFYGGQYSETDDEFAIIAVKL